MSQSIDLNKDSSCPKCGSASVKVIGAPGRVFKDGVELVVPVRYSKVVECTNCHSVRGR